MLNVQKFVSDKTRLGFVKSGSTSVVHPPKFLPATSNPLPEVKVPKKEVLASRRTSVDLSKTNLRIPII